VLKYDDFGRLIEEGSIRANGRFSYKTTYTYNANGRLTEVTRYGGDSQLSSRRVYTYSGDERVPSEFTYYGGDGSIYERDFLRADYEFNSKGDWIKRRQTAEEGSTGAVFQCFI
jgi:YD repeat-containing protein